jgi:hypothetical protein
VYKDSVMALQKLLVNAPSEVQRKPATVSPCRMTRIPPEIMYFSNGIEYYCVEVTCDDGRQYAIQGYGEEAEALFKEAHKCAVCGNSIGEKKGELIEEQNREGKLSFIDNTCEGLLKKFESIYGLEFFKYR